MPTYIHFPDRCVSYDTFMDDLSSRIACKLQGMQHDPEMVSQRRAYELFGRANVTRWRREGRAKFCKRPGKVEYFMAELRLLQQTEQDYFKRPIIND